MPIEVVHEYDREGNETGWYTQSVPDVYVKEEPDCYDCTDAGCPECQGGPTPPPATATPGAENIVDPWGPVPAGSWGSDVGYSEEPPF
jgi:hypothetical protein